MYFYLRHAHEQWWVLTGHLPVLTSSTWPSKSIVIRIFLPLTIICTWIVLYQSANLLLLVVCQQLVIVLVTLFVVLSLLMELHHLYKFNESHSWIFISQMSFATLLFWCFSLFVFFMGSSLALFVLFLFLAYGQEICHCKRK